MKQILYYEKMHPYRVDKKLFDSIMNRCTETMSGVLSVPIDLRKRIVRFNQTLGVKESFQDNALAEAWEFCLRCHNNFYTIEVIEVD